MDVVASLEPISVDGGLASGQEAGEENGHHPSFTMGILTFAIDVGVAQASRIEAVGLVVEVEVTLYRELGHTVRRKGPSWVVFVRRKVVLFPVDGSARGGEDDLGDTTQAGGLEEAKTSHHVDIGIEGRILHRSTHIHLCGMVYQDRSTAGLDQPSRFGTADIEFVKLDLRRQILRAAPGEIIDHMDSKSIA